MIAIIDYGLGNVLAIVNVYKRLNVPVLVAKSREDLAGATKLILPGVGSFDEAMRLFDRSGMRPHVEKLVLEQQMPIVGICVGMQMLADSSEEGALPGLGWVPGRVKKFDVQKMPRGTNLPHMGWNDVQPVSDRGLFAGLAQDARFYFLHSYYFDPLDPQHALASTDCGLLFSCAVRKDNVHGVQFHPEKSHHCGSRLLGNFAKL